MQIYRMPNKQIRAYNTTAVQCSCLVFTPSDCRNEGAEPAPCKIRNASQAAAWVGIGQRSNLSLFFHKALCKRTPICVYTCLVSFIRFSMHVWECELDQSVLEKQFFFLILQYVSVAGRNWEERAGSKTFSHESGKLNFNYITLMCKDGI